MNWLDAERWIMEEGVRMHRTTDPDRVVFQNEYGDMVQQRPGEPQTAFTLSEDDDQARNWEFVRQR